MESELLWAVRLLRGLSAFVEVSIFVALWRADSMRSAIRLSTVPGLMGPVIFVGVMLLGVAGVAGKLSPLRLGALLVGAALILWGTRS
ncbi:MAG TPA: DUF2619 domain-containing protein [Symbiobacteriaceae bacterium]|nr:DUF2619 domain-containing protein [Symbiobacteriaceae bacterium]